jgi:hypothetical protein
VDARFGLRRFSAAFVSPVRILASPSKRGKEEQKEKQKRRKSAAVQSATVIETTRRPKWAGYFLPVALAWG